MGMSISGPMKTNDLGYLRKESLETVLLCLTAGSYMWCIMLLTTHDRFGPWWWGLAVLGTGLLTAFSVRARHPSLAAGVIVLSLAAAELSDMWLGNTKTAPYMLTVAVSLAGLLFGPRVVAWTTALCSGSVLAIGLLRYGQSAFSLDLWSPMLVIGAVGILSSLAVRDLYQALVWFRERATAAQHNEEELRERQGQLSRTVKALDEAYRRLEYLSYDLARAREAAEEARLAKQRLMTQVSHELRTPLNVIVAFSEMMYLSPERYSADSLPPEFRGDIREIYRSSKHLLRLIDDVLAMSQIEVGQMRIELEPVWLREVIAEAVDIIRPLVREGVTLCTDVPEDLPQALIDRARVQQVLLNLLNNARRFTERGSITVQATREAEQIRITVADTGIGVSPSEHDKMFKEFQHLDAPLARGQEGTGLGLAISKRFVEMHGGSIWVESEGVPGQGSRFHFTLPLVGSEPVGMSALHGTQKRLSRPVGRGRTLLLLDQDTRVVKMLEQGLEEYQVVPVDEVAEVPRLVSELHARAVVLNLAQRSNVGRQVRELRQRLGESPLPIVLCSLVGERQLERELGVVDYLVKPVARDVLMALLDRLGEGIRRVLVVDDDPQMVRLLSRLLQTAPREYEVLRAYDGRQGLQEMRDRHPDLVLLDITMPEVDGYGVLAQMQEDDELRRVPVAVITARELTPDEERRLGGRTLMVSTGAGFTNQETLACLRGILDSIGISLSS